MATLRVSTTGDDSNTYSEVAAGAYWATPTRAVYGSTDPSSPSASEAAAAGDTVIVESGTYTVEAQFDRFIPALECENSGSSGSPITLKCEGTVTLQYAMYDSGTTDSATANTLTDSSQGWATDELVDYAIKITSGTGSGQVNFITGNTDAGVITVSQDWETTPSAGDTYEIWPTGPVLGVLNNSYIIWTANSDGSEWYIDEQSAIANPDTGPVTVVGSNNCEVQYVHVAGLEYNNGDNHPGIRIENSNDCIVKNNKIHDFSLLNNNIKNAAGVQTYGARDCEIAHNEIYNCGSALFIKGENSQTQYGNQVHHNLCYDNTHGIVMILTTGTTNDTWIYQNVVLRTENYSIDFNAAFVSAPDITNVKVFNNTFWKDATTANHQVNAYHYDYLDNIEFRNNIVSGTDENQMIWMRKEGGALTPYWDGDYNLYYNAAGTYDWDLDLSNYSSLSAWQGASDTGTIDANSTQEDPVLTDPANDDATLDTGSPCFDDGIDTFDLLGGGTSASINKGAYILSGQTDVIGIETIPSVAQAKLGGPSSFLSFTLFRGI